jgi:mycothiol synthase
MTTILADGFIMRPVTLEDTAACLTLFNRVSQAGFNTDDWSMEDVQAAIDSLNLPDDGRVIMSPNHEVLAYGEVHFNHQPPTHPTVRIVIDPEYEERDFGKHLLQWGEARARTAVEQCPPEYRVVYRVFIDDKHPASVSMVEQMAMQPVRKSWLLQIDKPAMPQSVPELRDLTIRPMRYPDELAAVVRVTMETLYDMWGMYEEPFEVVFERYQKRLAADSDFEPAIWFVVEDDISGELAAMCLCDDSFRNDHNMGFIAQLGVRRTYRRRGIANALLLYTFSEFWQQGKARVAVGVDGESTTGAIELYLQSGMVVTRTGMFYEKELRPGWATNNGRL